MCRSAKGFPRRRWAIVVSVLGALVLIGALLWTGVSRPTEVPHTASQTSSPDEAHAWGRAALVGRPAPELELIDQYDRPFRLSDQLGRVVVLYFGYTHCPDTCPLTLHHFMNIQHALGDAAAQVTFAMITIDPERDTPERLKEYMGFFADDFLGLWGPMARLEKAYEAFGIYAVGTEAPGFPGGYWMKHSWAAYVVDPQGYVRLARILEDSPAALATVLRHMLD